MEICGMPAVHFPAGLLRHRHDPKKPSNVQFCSTEIKQCSQNRMFILGMGYVGEYVAQHLFNQGWNVSGTCTSVTKQERLNKLGLNVHLFNANYPPTIEVLNILNQHTHVLVSIPPCKDIGDPMLQHVEVLKRELNNECLQWLCYLSTTGFCVIYPVLRSSKTIWLLGTRCVCNICYMHLSVLGVYGDCGGAWVDENYQPNPPTELLKLRLAAEVGWLSLGHDLGLAPHIFRLGGIYGPGRSAIDTIIKRGTLSDVQKGRSFKKYTSRVHVADICNALNESIHKPSPGRVYNIVDDDPAPRTQVFAFAHKLINEKWPTKIKKMASPATNESFTRDRNFRGEKRVVNVRMKNELGVKLFYPSYKSGLQSICDQMHDYPSLSSSEESSSNH